MCVLAIELCPQAQNIKCTDEALIVDLIDGHTISLSSGSPSPS